MAVISAELRAPDPTPVPTPGGSFCLSSYVYGSYQDYIPMYVYSVLSSYPDYYVRIFLREQLSPGNRRVLDWIRETVSDRFDVRENYFQDIRSDNSVVLKTLRWLLPYDDVRDFDYLYVGDVDFLILPETPGMLEMHVGHCREQGLPYSNAVRVKQPPVRKLSGLHFIEVKPYYERMGALLDAERSKVSQCEDPYPGITSNEFILYDLVEKGIGKFPSLHFRPTHGIHLGYARTGEITKEFVEPWKALFLKTLWIHPAYGDIRRRLARKQRRELARVEQLCTGQWWRRLF